MAEKSEEHLVEVVIKRDFWDKDGQRHVAGTVVKVPVDAALEGVESGALGRVKRKANAG
jgi:hypothetical protein